MPPLRRTFAFADMYRVAVTVAEDLYLNVMRFRYELFNIDSVVAKALAASRFALGAMR